MDSQAHSSGLSLEKYSPAGPPPAMRDAAVLRMAGSVSTQPRGPSASLCEVNVTSRRTVLRAMLPGDGTVPRRTSGGRA